MRSINASLHRGNTWTLTKFVEEEILKFDSRVEFDEIHLEESGIPFFCGCSFCYM